MAVLKDFKNLTKEIIELIIEASGMNRKKILSTAYKNNVKISHIGKIISEKGIHFAPHLDMKNIKKFDHFS